MPVLALTLMVMTGAWSGPEQLRAALALETEGRDSEAIAALEKLAVKEKDWELPKMEAARIYLKLGKELPRARAHLSAALKRAATNPRAHYLWGLVREEEGAKEEAIAALEKAVELRPSYAEARFRLAGLHAQQGAWDKAESHYRHLARAHPERTSARLQLAVAFEKQGKLEDAERELRKLWDEQPESIVVQRKLTEFYERTGRPKLAEAVRSARPGEERKLRPLKPSRR